MAVTGWARPRSARSRLTCHVDAWRQLEQAARLQEDDAAIANPQEAKVATEQKSSDEDEAPGRGGDALLRASPTTGPARPTSSRSPTARSARWTCARSRSTEDDFGMMAYDPAFTNTASCRSAITYIDGEAGVLEHRGIPIEQLCEQSSYLEVAYLLIFGELPTAAAARALGLRHHPPHLRPRGHQEVHRGLPLRRAPDGDAARLASARSRPSTPTRSTSTTPRSATWRRSG